MWSRGPSTKSVVVFLGGVVACIFGAGYGARYAFNERANIKAKDAVILEMKQKDSLFQQYMTPAEQKTFQVLKDSANARYIDYQAKTVKPKF